MEPNVVPVAVVVPVANGDRYFRRLKSSLIAQGAAETIIVVDDGSNLQEVRAVLDGVPNLRVLATPGRIGAGPARNVGVRATSQPWLTFLDVDDWWPDDFLRQLYARADADVVAYDHHLWSESDGADPVPLNQTVFERAGWTGESIDLTTSAKLLSGFPMLKLLMKRSAFLEVGGFRPLVIEDFDIQWRLIAAGYRIQIVHEPIGNYVVHSRGTTGSVQGDRRAWERAQRSWLTIWLSMARSKNLPAFVRRGCLKEALSTMAHLTYSVLRRQLGRP